MNSSDKEDTVGKEMMRKRLAFYESEELNEEEKQEALFEGKIKKYFKRKAKERETEPSSPSKIAKDFCDGYKAQYGR